MEESYQRYIDGDDSGIVEIIKSYREGLILYTYGFTNNIFTAEEIVDDVFFKLMVKKPPYSGRTTFKTWLYTITRHNAIDYLRRRMLHPSVSIDEIQDHADRAELENSYLKKEIRIQIFHALNAINESYRMVLYLSFFEEFSNEQLSKILGKSKRQIEMLKYRGLQALKKELAKKGVDYEILG